MLQIINHAGYELAKGQARFHAAAAILADCLSLTSRRVYDCKFRAWCEFADKHDISADDVGNLLLREFIIELL